MLHTDTVGHVLLNGHVSESFPIMRGVRQGCPLSAIFYALYIEPFGFMLEHEPRLVPLNFPGRVAPKTLQYADDITFLLSEKSSLTKLFQLCSKFQAATGSTINADKTQGLALGNPVALDPYFTTIEWRNEDGIDILGISFLTDYYYTRTLNWRRLLKSVKNTLHKMASRTLSLKGKVLVLNSNVLSKIWYTASILPIPAAEFQALERYMFDFLWSGKTSPLQRRTVYLPKDQGGLGLLHPLYQQKSLQLKLLYGVVDAGEKHYATQLPRYWFGRRLGVLRPEWHFLTSNHLPHFVGHHFPPYYKDLLETFLTMDMSKLPKGPVQWTTKLFYLQFLHEHKHEPRAFQDFWSAHRVDCSTMWKHVFSTLGNISAYTTAFYIASYQHKALCANGFAAKGLRICRQNVWLVQMRLKPTNTSFFAVLLPRLYLPTFILLYKCF